MSDLLAVGKGTFSIKKVKSCDEYGEDLITKAGDKKIMLVIDLTDSMSASATIFEHLTARAAWKIEAICKSVGHAEVYKGEANCFSGIEAIESGRGNCMISHQEAANGYPAREQVAKYLLSKVEPVKVDYSTYDDDDDIPF